MRFVKPILFTTVLFLGAASFSTVDGQRAGVNRLSPNALVADLYRVHNRKHSPFFQTRSRALLYKYFEKDLGGHDLERRG